MEIVFGFVNRSEIKRSEEMTKKTIPEKYSELIDYGYIKPTTEHVDLVMPSVYRTVRTGLMYDVPEPPLDTNIPDLQTKEDAPEQQDKEGVRADAKLECNSRRNKKENGRGTHTSS